MLPYQLWCHIRGSPAEDLLLLAILAESREPKVNYFDHVCFVLDENVVKLHISVCDSSHVEIVEAFRDLLEEAAAYILFDLSVGALLLHVLVERNALDEIGDDANLLARLDQVVHTDDIGVIYALQGHYLALDRLSFHAVVQLCLLVNLDRVLFHGRLMVANVNDGVGTLANWFPDLVVIQMAVPRGPAALLMIGVLRPVLLARCPCVFQAVSLHAQ